MSSLIAHFPLEKTGKSTPNHPWVSFIDSSSSMSEKSNYAYKLYSYCYPPLALLAYLIVWRGRLLKHIGFFRDTINKHPYIVDLATGDGTLTKKALFPMWKKKVDGLLALDISEHMLAKATKKLPETKTVFVHGDVMELPFRERAVECITCFGGFNSFASGAKAMREMGRTLSDTGILRGSVLLTPERPWKRKTVDLFIRWGLQTEHVSHESFLRWVSDADLKVNDLRKHGDVLLFEVSRKT